jgi:hypothetical protein
MPEQIGGPRAVEMSDPREEEQISKKLAQADNSTPDLGNGNSFGEGK